MGETLRARKQSRNPGRRRAWVLILVVAAAGVGHWAYWYAPRVRRASPSSSSGVADILLAESNLDVRIWVPFPHQNLGALSSQVGDIGVANRALEDLLGVSAPRLPPFGPFRLPPATELAAASDLEGRQFVLAMRVYPLARWLFRAAGVLAGNPWLKGGEMDLGGRRVRISWQGGLWQAVTDGVRFGTVPSRPEIGPALACVRLNRDLGPLPEGVFRLIPAGDDLLLTSDLANDSAVLVDETAAETLSAALAWTRFGARGDRSAVRSWVAVTGLSKGRGGLPPVVLAQRGLAPIERLPGERFLKLAGVSVQSRTVGDWRLKAYEEETLAMGEAVLPYLVGLASAAAQQGVITAGDLDLAKARLALQKVGMSLQTVPIIGEAEAGRWLAATGALNWLSNVRGLSFRSATHGRLEVLIRLHRAD